MRVCKSVDGEEGAGRRAASRVCSSAWLCFVFFCVYAAVTARGSNHVRQATTCELATWAPHACLCETHLLLLLLLQQQLLHGVNSRFI